MDNDCRAKLLLTHEPRNKFYVGRSYDELSRIAQAICRESGKSGQTIMAGRHLRVIEGHMGYRASDLQAMQR